MATLQSVPAAPEGELVTEGTLCIESASSLDPESRVTVDEEDRSDCRKAKSLAGVQTVDGGVRKDFLTSAEMDLFLAAARGGRYGVRDYAMMLLSYRHGLRVSELIDIRIADIDLATSRLFVKRLKGSLSTSQPIEGDELRAIRAWLRERSLDEDAAAHSPLLFLSERGPFTRQAVNYLVSQISKRAGLPFKTHPHMLRHSCGFYLANKGLDTRLIQDYLGHRSVQHTSKYTRTAASRFEGLWR
ncbi:MAG TPA: tyrosine-type recombinase/integrase [Blastocatellia bacterium]|nr:tyrosine-type recombinase/integrase [Blastocatellia bacterium]